MNIITQFKITGLSAQIMLTGAIVRADHQSRGTCPGDACPGEGAHVRGHCPTFYNHVSLFL